MPKITEIYDDDSNPDDCEGSEQSVNLLADEYMSDEDEDDPLQEFNNYLSSLHHDDLKTQFDIWKAWLQDTARQIASAPDLKDLPAMLQTFDEQALKVQLIQQMFLDNFNKEIY